MANDFTGDGNCVALWKVDNGALTTDSIGTNTLTDNNTVGTSTGDKKEGDASADFELGNSESLTITDANLDAGFPLKNGDTTPSFSVCLWFKQESQAAFQMLFSKNDSGGNKRSLLIAVFDNDLTIYNGYNGGASGELIIGANDDIVTGRWYHLAYTYNDSTKAWKVVLWDDTAGSKTYDGTGSPDSGTATNNINIEDAPVALGVQYNSGSPQSATYYDGLMDEVVVFDDILTTDEIDQIRQGTYGASSGTVNNIDSHLLNSLNLRGLI